jgi:glycosyltransferase involved in cell wall biosynthesis
VKISIVTPSFNQPDWLRLCLASVADQAGADVEHLVQDGSDEAQRPAVADVCGAFPNVALRQETDHGMYDALNRGFQESTGDLCGYLNCDEQYLPGALSRVGQCFANHPEADVVFGDALVVDENGEYTCHRQSLRPRLRHTVICHFAVLTCALFFRRHLIERGYHFDTAYRAIGDLELMARWLREGVRMHHLPDMLSVFTDMGSNLGASSAVTEEMQRLRKRFPPWWRLGAFVWAGLHRYRKWRAGYYKPQPLEYSIYTRSNPTRRTTFQADQPTAVWKSRLRAAG